MSGNIRKKKNKTNKSDLDFDLFYHKYIGPTCYILPILYLLIMFVFFLDINECDTGDVCNGGVCTDTPGSYTCDCTGTGYDGDFCTNGRSNSHMPSKQRQINLYGVK